ncbi:MAG: SDR family NAD(P)-dependent oxidoreductase [Anaerolineae bacterium]|nr:SDR family NAD(P)-dependent oxidoreductase [Anaerolineae bacterium]
MQEQVVLVTGASSGIGAAIAQDLATQGGFYVFAAARRMDRLEQLRTKHIEPLYLDLTDHDSIQAAVTHIMASKKRVDVLVNNAGYGLYGAVEGVIIEEARHQFEVNVFGLGRMTQAILPIMRQQRSGRIINVSSVAGKVSTPMAGWYSASKHAVEALSDALRGEVQRFGIKVSVIEPGAIRTEFEEVALGELSKTDEANVYRDMAAAFAKLVGNNYRRAPQADVVARAVRHAVTARHPRLRYALPMDSRTFIFLRGLLGDRLLDRMILSQLRG